LTAVPKTSPDGKRAVQPGGNPVPMVTSMMSGPPVAKEFARGWALPIFTWGKAHWFARIPDSLHFAAACGALRTVRGQLHEPGDWTRCKNCAAKVDANAASAT